MSNIDPTSTTPGLAETPVKREKVDIACRRHPPCGSNTAYKIPVQRRGLCGYECTGCGYAWTLAVGGAIDI